MGQWAPGEQEVGSGEEAAPASLQATPAERESDGNRQGSQQS